MTTRAVHAKFRASLADPISVILLSIAVLRRSETITPQQERAFARLERAARQLRALMMEHEKTLAPPVG